MNNVHLNFIKFYTKIITFKSQLRFTVLHEVINDKILRQYSCNMTPLVVTHDQFLLLLNRTVFYMCAYFIVGVKI